MAPYILIDCRRRRYVIDAVALLAENCVLMFNCFNFSTDIRFYVRVLIETNVNVSNELIF